MYLEELQARADGCVRGNTLLVIISCALSGLVQQLHQSTETKCSSYFTIFILNSSKPLSLQTKLSVKHGSKKKEKKIVMLYNLSICHLVRILPLSWCFSIKQKGLIVCPDWGLQLHLTPTRCLNEWEKPVRAVTQWHRHNVHNAHYHPDGETLLVCLCLVYCTKVHSHILEKDMFSDLMASESMWTGAIRSSRNLTISRKGLVGCLGNVSLRVISLCTQYKQKGRL